MPNREEPAVSGDDLEKGLFTPAQGVVILVPFHFQETPPMNPLNPDNWTPLYCAWMLFWALIFMLGMACHYDPQD